VANRGHRLRVAAAAAVVGGLLAGSYLLVERRPGQVPTAAPVVPLALLPGPSQAPLPDPVPAVRAALARYAAARRAHTGIAVLDRVTGRAVGYEDGARFPTASVVKLDILATLLWQHQRTGRPLSAGQKHAATEMITESDNEAADALWTEIGGASGLAQANRVFGLTRTTPNRAGYWGLTTTTAADQVRLLGVLADPAGPLSAGSRGYALGLLARVRAGQRWGVPRAAAGPTAVYVKDGWLASVADRGRWIVNSVGRIIEPGHDWLVAVLSDHNPTEGGGIGTVEHLATTAVAGLRATPNPVS